MQAEEKGGDAVGQAHGDDAERAARLQRHPHEGDVVERIAELARGDGEKQVPEVVPAQEPQRPRRRAGRELEALFRQRGDGVGHRRKPCRYPPVRLGR